MEGRLISQLPERGLRRELRRHPFPEDATFAILSFILLEKVFARRPKSELGQLDSEVSAINSSFPTPE